MLKKIAIIGHFGANEKHYDGQSVKTRIVASEIENNIGIDNTSKIDTYGWKKHPFRLLINCVKSVNDSENVVFLTDAGGIKVFPWLLTCANVIKKRPIFYIVIGGWLVHFLEKNKMITWFLKKLNGIFVETEVMQTGLKKMGFKNVFLMPNFKDLQLLKEEDLLDKSSEPFRFCIFSRVMKEKGIEPAVEAIQNINKQYGWNICSLDIYGQVDSNQVEWFNELQKSFSSAVKYNGIIPFDRSVDVLKDYYALLFPTQFYTEGIPGTIIDAYAAGLPVIASEWESVRDIVDADVTGISYDFDKPDLLQKCMEQFIENPQMVNGMRKNCLAKAEEYLPDAVMSIFLSKLS